jgi:hypothetical protein
MRLATPALAVLLLTAAAHARPPLPAPVVCRGAIQHPIDVRVETLDPVRRGHAVRVRITTRSSRPLERAEVRLVHAGGATIAGPVRVALGTMRRDVPAPAEFRVIVPASARRALLQFAIVGDEDGLRLGRGATVNLLPDGPTRPIAVLTEADGATLRVYGARRIDR